jgi:RHS repeat-associated protein
VKESGTINALKHWNTLHVLDGNSRLVTVRVGADEDDDTPEVKYNLEDHLGNSSVMVDSDGDLVNREEYYPFGDSSFGAFAKKRYRYNGKEKDGESGLYNYGMRYYAPWMCRFVSVDPLAAEYPHYTPYQYAGNKPINFVDLDGLEEFRLDDPAPTQQEMNGSLDKAESTGGGKTLTITAVYGVVTAGEGAVDGLDFDSINKDLDTMVNKTHEIKINKRLAEQLGYEKGEPRVLTVNVDVSVIDIGDGSAFMVDRGQHIVNAAVIRMISPEEMAKQDGAEEYTPAITILAQQLDRRKFSSDILVNSDYFGSNISDTERADKFESYVGHTDARSLTFAQVIAHEIGHDLGAGEKHHSYGILSALPATIELSKADVKRIITQKGTTSYIRQYYVERRNDNSNGDD